jgi:hypothetical protein
MVAAHDVSGPPLATAAATSMVGAGLSPDVAVLQQTGLGDAIIPLDSSVDLAAALGLQALSRAETHGLDSGGLMLGFVTDALRPRTRFALKRTPTAETFVSQWPQLRAIAKHSRPSSASTSGGCTPSPSE